MSTPWGPTAAVVPAADRHGTTPPGADRDHGALRALLEPRSVAVIGASSDPERIGGRPLALLQQRAFPGALYVVNPRHERIGSLRSYASVAELPESVDLVIVATPAAEVPDVLRQSARRGVKAAYVLSSGFGESSDPEGPRLEAEIGSAIAGSGLRVAGPNGEGVYNVAADFVIGFSPTVDLDRGLATVPLPGNVGVVAQSGGVGFGIFHRGLARGLGFSHVISTGNEVDLETLDFVDHLIGDAGTELIVMFVEGFKDPSRVAATAARALEAAKPLIVAKVGHSDAAARAAQSHTGHLAGPSALYRAVFKRYGMVEVSDVDELLDVASALSAWGPAPGGRIGIVTMSGGAGAWLADACDEAGLDVPVLDQDRQDSILHGLPSYAAARNPVDLTAGSAGPDVAAAALGTLAGSPAIDIVVVAMSLLGGEPFRERWAPFQAALDAEGKPVLVFSYTEPSGVSRSTLADAGYPWFCSQRGVARAALAMVQYGRARARAVNEVPVADDGEEAVPGFGGGDDRGCVIPEHAAKRWLAALGLPVPLGRLASSAEGAVEAAAAIRLPAALKVQSAALPHKSEVGGVALDISSLEQVASTFERLDAVARQRLDPSLLDGVLVEEMVPSGFEMMVGLLNDPDLGLFVLIGRGGTAAELDPDSVIAPAPVSEGEARDLVLGLRCAPGLMGRRGAPPADVAALCSIVARVSWAGSRLDPRLSELDLNPVIVHESGRGAHIADALIVLADDQHRPMALSRPGPLLSPLRMR